MPLGQLRLRSRGEPRLISRRERRLRNRPDRGDRAGGVKDWIRQLEGELADADIAGDSTRSERARAGLQFLTAELAAAYGLGRRARQASDLAERARSAVGWRIRGAIKRIGEVHPELPRHLKRSIRTGVWCAYEPDEPVSWQLPATY